MVTRSPITTEAPAPDGAGDAGYVTGALYDRLASEAAAMGARTDPADRAATEQAAAVLYHEARLLDGRHYRDWLALLSDDCIYWLASDLAKLDPRRQSAVNFDDRRRLIDRVAVIETGQLRAQDPPSRTVRSVTNVEAWPGAGGVIDARSNIVIWEHRRGRTERYVGWQDHQLVGGAGRWRVRKKVINLLDADEPQGNVTFIL
jgi:3-phenylpropionate/cinnamic acid dioxygenase small subunit